MARPRAASTVRFHHIARDTRDYVAQRSVALPLGLVADNVFLAEPLERGSRHRRPSDQIREATLGAPEIGNADPQEQHDHAKAQEERPANRAVLSPPICTSGSRR